MTTTARYPEGYPAAIVEWKALVALGGAEYTGMDDNDIPWPSAVVMERAFVCSGVVLKRADVAAAREAYIEALEAAGFWG